MQATDSQASAADEPLAYGVRRISRDAGRKAAGTLHSDVNQDDRIAEIVEENGGRLLDILDETNVSGSTPLDRRPYGWAIGEVEAGRAHMIVFAHSDRHDRSLVVNQQAVKRMDEANGILLAGSKTLSHRTADEWFDSSLHSLLNERQLRVLGERTQEGVATAVSLGRLPYPSAPLGLELYGEHNNVRPVADEAILDVVREAFDMRDQGATIDAVRLFLAEHGHVRTYRSVCRLLGSPLYIGEIRYGGNRREDGTFTPMHVNRDLGFTVVNRDVWERVQTMRVPSGRQAKSERLLARLGVLLCGGCEGRMIAGANRSPNGTRNTFYRCGRGRTSDCPERAVIHAERIERFVIEEVRRELEDIVERESAMREAKQADSAARAAEDVVEDAEVKYLELGPGRHTRAYARLEVLREEAITNRAYADRLLDALPDVEDLDAATVLDDDDPDSVPAKRALIKRVMRGRVVITPGRLPFDDRVTVKPLKTLTTTSA